MTVHDTVRVSRSSEFRALSRALDDRIAEMRRLLAQTQPLSTAGALRVLRDAYPDVPLETRLRALGGSR